MSLLAPRTPPVPTSSPAIIKREVSAIKAAPRRLTDLMYREWETAFDLLWTTVGGITPAQRIAALGTDAAELFASSTALVTFLVTILTGKDDALVVVILAKVATIPAYTTHEDGTVTLD